MQTNGKPTWFALKLERREVLELLPPEKLSHVLKMCFDFLETRQRPDGGDALERLAFAAIAPDIEGAWEKYDVSVRNGRKGGRPSKTQGFSENSGVFGKPGGTYIDIEENKDKEKDADEDIDTEKGRKTEEGASAPPAPARTSRAKDKEPVRHRYGRYENVLLSDEERAALQREFPLDLSERIERLSEYLASSGRSYKSHAATLRVWARRDREKGARENGEFSTNPRQDLPKRIPSVLDDCFAVDS